MVVVIEGLSSFHRSVLVAFAVGEEEVSQSAQLICSSSSDSACSLLNLNETEIQGVAEGPQISGNLTLFPNPDLFLDLILLRRDWKLVEQR